MGVCPVGAVGYVRAHGTYLCMQVVFHQSAARWTFYTNINISLYAFCVNLLVPPSRKLFRIGPPTFLSAILRKYCHFFACIPPIRPLRTFLKGFRVIYSSRHAAFLPW